MIVDNISEFVVSLIESNKSSNLIDAWKSKKNQEMLGKVIKKNNIMIKDPDKPKRGKSGYLYFCAEYRDKIKKENPQMTVKEVVRKLGVLWQKMKVDGNNMEVKKFEKMSLDDRNRYKTEMDTYVPLIRKINKKDKKGADDGCDDLLDEDINYIDEEKKKKRKMKEKVEEEKELKKSKRKERDDGYSKFLRSKRNKTKKTHPELDSDGILKYLETKWSKFTESKKEKYRNKK